MAQLGFGLRRECAAAEASLKAAGLDGPGAVLKVLQKRKSIDPALAEHIVTAFGRHPEIAAALAQKPVAAKMD